MLKEGVVRALRVPVEVDVLRNHCGRGITTL
jgi:hypothetical protein